MGKQKLMDFPMLQKEKGLITSQWLNFAGERMLSLC